MRSKFHGIKIVGALLTGGVLAAGGCSLDGLVSQASIGFARQIGAIPAQAVYDLTIGPIIDDIIGGGTDETP